MGAIKKTKAGNYQASAYDVRGVRHRKTFNKQAEAQAFINKIESDKYDRKLVGAKLKKSRVSFDSALEDYLLTKTGLAKKTITKYEFTISQFKEFISSLKLFYVDQFTPDHGTLLFNVLVQGNIDSNGNTVKPKPKTVNHFLQMIRSFFTLEVEKGHIDRNPLIHIKNLKEENPRPEFYTEEELEAFFKQEMPQVYRNAFIGLLHTGMRINELVNISWDDIDFKNRLIHVRSKDGFNTKTDNSERSIPINGTLMKVLERVVVSPLSEQYPFCSITGCKLSDRRLLEACKEIAVSANIKGRAFLHKFRHTFATHLVKRRVPIEAVQKLLGHGSIIETMVYAHVRSEELHPDVELLNNLGSANNTISNNGSEENNDQPKSQVFDLYLYKAA